MKEQILVLRVKVSHSAAAEGWATIAASAPTASLPTIGVQPAATVLLLEPTTNAFAEGILPTTGTSMVLA